MKTLISLFSFLFFFTINANAVVTVYPGAISYPTLGEAFAAIRGGLHTGAVECVISSSSIEPVGAFLVASGVGLASYTSVTVTCTTPVTLESTLSGTAVIVLIGADNVTIDGRIGGTGRNLTIRNNATNATSTAGCVHIRDGGISPPIDTAGAKHNVIRNCELSGFLPTSTFLDTYGILAYKGYQVPIGSGRNNDSNQYLDNRIVQCSYGIRLQGAFINHGNIIKGNIIDNIGKVGIYVSSQDNCLISENLVQNVGGRFAVPTDGQDRIGIVVGASGGNNTVTRNKIHDITDENTYSAIGILCSANQAGIPTNNLIANNEIYNIISNGTVNNSAIGIGHFGINSFDAIVYNSIYMVGDLDPPSTVNTTQSSCGIRIASEADSNTLVKNNSIYVDLTSNDTALLHCCIQMPSATYQFGSSSEIDNNDYYPGTNVPDGNGVNSQMRLGALGLTSAPSTFFATLAAWQTAFTLVPQDLNSISNDPLYCLSAPNYLIPCSIVSPLKFAGDPVAGVNTDILGEVRSTLLPTIGAYEFDSITLPVELSALTATVDNRDVTLNWTTASELNNSGFDIERRLVNSDWLMIGNVHGHGTVTAPQDYTFTDRGLAAGKYNYRLKQIDFNGNFEYFNLNTEIGIGVPTRYDLSQNYPNPFNPTTKINFDLPLDGKVSIKLFNISGREISTLVNEVKAAGYYTINFNATNLSSGVYFYTLNAKDFVSTKKMIFVK